MDDATVRAAAEDHARATVAGDLKTAGSYLTPEAMAQAGGVMKAMPGALSGCEVSSVEADGDEWKVQIRYSGETGEAAVASRWANRDEKPVITDLQVL